MKKIIIPITLGLLFVIFSGFMNSETGDPSKIAGIKWYSMVEAQKLAEKNDKKVFVYAHAEWCVYCKRMEKEVYPDEIVQEALNEHFYPVFVDIESKRQITFNGTTMTENEFAIKYRVTATPTVFFIDKMGNILGIQPGFIPADIFTSLLNYVGTDAFIDKKFADYLAEERNDKLPEGN